MPKYGIVIHELRETTWNIEAPTREEAIRIYLEEDPKEEDDMEPIEIVLGAELHSVIDPDGVEVPYIDNSEPEEKEQETADASH